MNRLAILRPQNITLSIVLLLFSLFLTLPAQAHKLNVFSWTGGNQIHGEAFFSGGRKAKNITIHIEDTETHSLLLTTQTNKQGGFTFTLPQKAVQQQLDLLISADSGDGHRGEWLMEASEYLVPKQSPSTGLASATATESKKESAGAAIEVEAIRKIVRQELEQKLIPIRRELAERQEKKVRLQDILGGIGCIIGLAVLLAWFQANKKKKTTLADR